MMHTQDLIRKQPISTPQHGHPRGRLVVMRVGRLVDYWVFAAGLAVGAWLAYPLITH